MVKDTPSSETQGQIVGRGKVRTGQKRRRQVMSKILRPTCFFFSRSDFPSPHCLPLGLRGWDTPSLRSRRKRGRGKGEGERAQEKNGGLGDGPQTPVFLLRSLPFPLPRLRLLRRRLGNPRTLWKTLHDV